MTRLDTRALAGAVLFGRYNENHDPDNGQFTSGDGGGGSGSAGGDTLYKDVGTKAGGNGKSGSAAGKSGGKGPAVSGATAQGQSHPYEGKSPRNDQGSGRLTGTAIARVFAPSADHEQSLKDSGATPLTFNELGHGGASVFHNLIGEAKSANKYGAAVTQYPVEDYGHGVRLFTTDDGKVGFALKGDDIVSVFKHPDSNAHDIVASILPLAVQEGGRRLDAFDTVLPHLYGAQGFKAVARTPFDENYQPPGWDKATFSDFNGGKPDVVFMVYDKDAAPYKAGDGASHKSYDDAMHAQRNAVASSVKASALYDQHADTSVSADNIIASVPGAQGAVDSAESRLSTSAATNEPVSKGGFIQPDGKYTPEREALHERILNELFSPEVVRAATPAPGEKPIMTLLGGRGGSGKSWFTQTGIADAAHAVYINSDELMAKLPGYQGWNAALFHEEASELTKQADHIARQLGVSVIHDATMRTPGGSAKRATEYKAAGYAVHGHYMFLPPQTSTKRALERFVRGGSTGRYVRPSYLLGSTTNERSFDGLKDNFDKWTIYDNTGSSPKLVAEGGASEQEKRSYADANSEQRSRRPLRERPELAGWRSPFFGIQGAPGRDDRAAQSRAGKEELAHALYFTRYNENHDPDNGQFASGDGGGSGGGGSGSTGGGSKSSSKSAPAAKAAAKTAPASPVAKSGDSSDKSDKRKAKLSDFEKAKIRIDGQTLSRKESVDKFIDTWDQKIGEDPDAFKKAFTGGVNTSMSVRVKSPGEWEISGEVLGDSGQVVGNYTRTIDFPQNKAESDFFFINRGERDHGLGKAMLAGNVAMYQKLGLGKVGVHANIDVGGYAWAKYGYVPTQSSWRSLSADIRSRLGARDSRPGHGSSGGDTYTPESWDELGDHEQEAVKDAWMRSTRDEFISSEIDNWRDNGGALDEAKSNLANGDLDWAKDTVNDFLSERADNGKEVPYTSSQIMKALTVDYERDGEGRNDPAIDFDDKELQEPSGYDKDQMDLPLPGVDKIEAAQRLTDDMRQELSERLTKAFNDQADDDQGDIEPPDLSDSVEEYQSESWDGMRERDRYNWARDNGELPEHEIENDDDDQESFDKEFEQGDVDKNESSEDTLMRLASSSNPKAVWAIADSPRGKELLLNSDWNGTLDFKDKETMDRFNAYVGKRKAA